MTNQNGNERYGNAAQEVLAAIVANTDDAIIGKDLEGIVTSWNRGAEALFGYTAAEMIGQSITRVIPPERREEESEILNRVRCGERLVHFETLRATRAGQVISVSLTISPIRDHAGNIAGVSTIARDLTQLQRLVRDLSQRDLLFRAISEVAPHGLILSDERGVVQSFSATAQKIFGYSQEEIVGRNLCLLMPSPDREKHDQYMQNYHRTGKKKIIGVGRILSGRRKDGTIFPLELQIAEVRVPGQHVFVGFVRDLTEHQHQEARLAELQAELLHVSRINDLGQMLSALAHEITQPLTAIANYVSGARRLMTSETPALLRKAMDRIGEQGERARNIVQSLRTLIRKDIREHREEDLDPLIREISTLAFAGLDRSTTLVIRVGEDARQVVVDKTQVQQVFLNLLRNGVEAMSGSPSRVLSVSAVRRGGMVEIAVTDTGPGLPERVRGRLFQPFLTTKADGLGVGLSICRTIVEAHGGQIDAETGASGTTFRFTLPRGDVSQIGNGCGSCCLIQVNISDPPSM